MESHSYLPNGRAASYHDNACHGDDAYLTRELNRDIVLDAVLDGATGRGGREASGYAAEVLQSARVETVEGLATLLEVANKQLFQRGRGRFFLTTVSVALKIGPELHVLSVGDSPVFLIRGGAIVPLTPTAKSHTFAGITNLLGLHEKLSYRATCISLEAQDRVVLATDGLIEIVAPGELAALVDHAPSPEEAISALRQLLCEKKRRNQGRVDDRSGFRRDDATAIMRYIGISAVQEASGSPERSDIV